MQWKPLLLLQLIQSSLQAGLADNANVLGKNGNIDKNNSIADGVNTACDPLKCDQIQKTALIDEPFRVVEVLEIEETKITSFLASFGFCIMILVSFILVAIYFFIISTLFIPFIICLTVLTIFCVFASLIFGVIVIVIFPSSLFAIWLNSAIDFLLYSF